MDISHTVHTFSEVVNFIKIRCVFLSTTDPSDK